MTRPLTPREVCEKYDRCAGRVLAPDAVSRSFELVESLERLPSA